MTLSHPILVIAYQDDVRASLEASLRQQDVEAVVCSSFYEAETQAMCQPFCGVLVDLTAMVKAKGEEKVVACSLTGFYPTLRVRTMGSVLVPMIMPGGARQERSLVDFLTKACGEFRPRALRAFRRHEMCVPAFLRRDGEEIRSFTVDLSWGGAFFVVVEAERFAVGEEVEVFFPDLNQGVRVSVRWVRGWGERRAPGIGCQFLEPGADFEEGLNAVLKVAKDQDRDRVVA
ncbi:PilZ domain-containing protein [Geomesophilobacter sediminis]|uniref:PilZ domain-containing protein n=1 Tax=Geomesophilobacter sediminis TaxID=2798584 RepID=A0A8J7JE25_9BACT|nr:PilZ domain-containing protein [Geomesophilobacter sediminis]MBJ6724119.1 PilZ domain-containing protein [Geomesophilobacter sediminis]